MRKKKTLLLSGLVLVILLAAAGYKLQDRVAAMHDDLSTRTTVQSQNKSMKPDSNTAEVFGSSGSQQGLMSGKGITAIGDSVMVGVAPYLKEAMPGIEVDGKVGRQMSQASKIVEDLKSRGKLGDRVVLELGTNGPFSRETLRGLLRSLSDVQRVVLVTARVPKGWEDSVNGKIEEAAGEFGNVTVFDWHAKSEGKEDYFYPDGVHLKPEGGRYYASLLADALR